MLSRPQYNVPCPIQPLPVLYLALQGRDQLCRRERRGSGGNFWCQPKRGGNLFLWNAGTAWGRRILEVPLRRTTIELPRRITSSMICAVLVRIYLPLNEFRVLGGSRDGSNQGQHLIGSHGSTTCGRAARFVRYRRFYHIAAPARASQFDLSRRCSKPE